MNHPLPTSAGMDGLWITLEIIFIMTRGTSSVPTVDYMLRGRENNGRRGEQEAAGGAAIR